MSSPWMLLKREYDRAATLGASGAFPLGFDEMFAFHAQHYFAFARPDFVIYGRPVIKGSDSKYLCDPSFAFPSHLCDCWLIHGMAGNMSKAWTILPWDLPWMAWERFRAPDRELLYVKTSVLKRLCPPKLDETTKPVLA